MRAIGMRPDVIFFLTDADDPMSASELAEIARLNRRARATICTIHFGRGPRQRENFLVDLANQSGGQYVYVDTTKF
jgi:Mg-chelatase subunit ChlD